jgi:hypothetical protein
MTTKDYKLIAECIYAAMQHEYTEETFTPFYGIEYVVKLLVEKLVEKDEGFNKERFYHACGIEL